MSNRPPRTRRLAASSLIGLVAGAVALTALPTAAHAAGTLPDATVVGGSAQVIAGTTVQVSFAPFAGLAAGQQAANRDTHIAIVSSAQACEDLRFMYPLQSESVAFRELANTIVRDVAIPSRANDPQIESYFLCAWQLGIAPFGAPAVSSRKALWRINPNPAGNGAATFAVPATPVIVAGATPTGVPVGGAVQTAISLVTPPSRGDSLVMREVRRSVVNGPNADTCASGVTVQKWDLLRAGFGATDALLNVPVPGGTVGKYLCIDQSVSSSSSQVIRTSPPVIALITGAQPTPAVTLQQAAAAVQGALSRVQNATSNLSALLANPQADPQQVQEAANEAQQAQEQLQGAQAVAAQADPANPVNQAADGGAIANTPNQQQANEQLRQQVEAALAATTVAVAPGSNPTLLTLSRATGFDPLSTPVIAEGKGNAAGISLKVTKPRKITRGKGFSVTLNVAPKTTRGGMRQYLLRMDKDEATLIHKRSGFITTGSRAKKYWISPKAPKGTYLLLSTFAPSVPGTPGTSIATPITVR